MIWYLIWGVLVVFTGEILAAAQETSSYYNYSPTHTFTVRRESWNTLETEANTQLANGIDLVYGTLFQNLSFLDRVGLSSFKEEVCDQSLLLRRLYLFLGLSGLEYRQTIMEKESPWPFPLATVLTQGQRVLIVLEDVPSDDFLNFITENNFSLFYERKYSSHGVEFQEETRDLREVKIRKAFRRLKVTEKVLGLDFPFGGVGTPLPNGHCVGPRGMELRGRKLKKNMQLGHLHLYAQDFPIQRKTAILVGIEGCAPGTKNQLGCTHNILSGLRNQKVNRSVSGGMKWARLEVSPSPPAEYEGKIVRLSRQEFEEIKAKIKMILNMEEEEQKALFKKILPEDGFYVKGFLWTYQGWAGK
jgi:hypothetical protein